MVYKNRTFFVLLISVSIFCGTVAIYAGCTNEGDESSSSTTGSQIQAGKELAQQYCGACHLPVSPDMLDRETWENNVLPAMAPKLGIGVWGQNQYYPADHSTSNFEVSFADWIKILEYFKEEAPEILEASDPPQPLKESRSIFSFEIPDVSEYPEAFASTMMVKIDPETKNIYTSDAHRNALIQWNRNLNSKQVFSFSHPTAVHMDFLEDSNRPGSAVVTTIGTMRAEDIARGVVQNIRLEADTAHSVNTIASELNRPVKTLRGDFNKDGLDDWVICEFGHTAGGLYLYQQQSDRSFTKKAIREVPGAIDGFVDDFNDDGWPDMMVLFAYDNEGIWMFINDKEGGFEQKNLLRFPPVYGSTSFQLVDINEDGLRDIILTNGDNADYSPILKPYHGLHIYVNKGGYDFEEAYSYPINGTTKAIAEDFDNDGDLDIATISFFADYENNPAESFIYFEQKSEMEFEPHALPIHEHGRWISMDADDIDGDGDLDIVLGNFSIAFMGQDKFEPTWDTQNPMLLLVNETR